MCQLYTSQEMFTFSFDITEKKKKLKKHFSKQTSSPAFCSTENRRFRFTDEKLNYFVSHVSTTTDRIILLLEPRTSMHLH